MDEPKAKIRILIADDHPVVCSGLTAIIQAEPAMMAVGQAGDGHQAVQMFRQHRPDVTLMDLRMPGMGGVEAIVAIRKDFPDARFVVLTTYRGDEDVHRALRAGAQAYLLKGMSHTELVDAIRTVHRGHQYLPAPVLESLSSRLPDSELSERETEVLSLIVKGMTNRQIGDALGITEGTVKWYVNVIFSKLDVRDRTEAAVTALDRGIVEM